MAAGTLPGLAPVQLRGDGMNKSQRMHQPSRHNGSGVSTLPWVRSSTHTMASHAPRHAGPWEPQRQQLVALRQNKGSCSLCT